MNAPIFRLPAILNQVCCILFLVAKFEWRCDAINKQRV
jgi:hypothetical protein